MGARSRRKGQRGELEAAEADMLRARIEYEMTKAEIDTHHPPGEAPRADAKPGEAADGV